MRVLLSAYACLPNSGSESGIGWRWAVEIARMGHDVAVVTRDVNREGIEAEISGGQYENLQFVFYDAPRMFRWSLWYRVWPFRLGHRAYWFVWEHIYHFVWQIGAFHAMKAIHVRKAFDVVHHITYGAARRATFMGGIKGARIILGPLGGGERSPLGLRGLLPWPGKLVEATRDFSIVMAKLNPFLFTSFKSADVIYLKTKESLFLVPKRYRYKARVRLEIGQDDNGGEVQSSYSARTSSDAAFRVLFVGRFLYWKGMAYGIHAFAKLVHTNPDARLVIIGKGPEEHCWRKLVEQLSIDQHVEWISWLDRSQLTRYYRESDVFLFPSLHDSSGNVVLESLSNGLPVICFDLGGPATIVDKTCGTICSTKSKDTEAVIVELYEGMKSLCQNRRQLSDMKAAAIHHSKTFYWSKIVDSLYEDALRDHGQGEV